MNREQFLSASSKPEVFSVPIVGIGEVWFRKLTGSEKIGFESWLRPGGKLSDDRSQQSVAKLITLCVCDETGRLILNDADIAAILEKPADTLTQLSEVAYKCAGLSEEAFAAAIKKKFDNLDGM